MIVKTLALAMGMAAILALPLAAHSDGISLNVNLGADDEAHFHFGGDHRHFDHKLLDAARALQNAKHKLWESRGHDDPDGAKLRAIGHINQALDDLQWIADHHPGDRY
jgi:hypothetical protein